MLKRLAICMLLTALLGGLSCRRSQSDGGETGGVPTVLQPEQLSVAGITLGETAQAVAERLGAPDSTAEELEPGGGDAHGRVLYYPGLEIHVVHEKVVNLRCRSPRWPTADGIKVGDSRSRIIATYGPSQEFQQEDGVILTYWSGSADVHLIFYLKDDRITEIELWFDFV